jgi:WD40 repeat protein
MLTLELSCSCSHCLLYPPPDAFIYPLPLCASFGIERDIQLWHAMTGRQMGLLTGHQSSVCNVVVRESLNQLISVSKDKVTRHK